MKKIIELLNPNNRNLKFDIEKTLTLEKDLGNVIFFLKINFISNKHIFKDTN